MEYDFGDIERDVAIAELIGRIRHATKWISETDYGLLRVPSREELQRTIK